MFIYNPHIKSKSHNDYILVHNPLFALYIFRRTKDIETIVTVVYKRSHLVLGFQHTCVKFVGFLIFHGTPTYRWMNVNWMGWGHLYQEWSWVLGGIPQLLTKWTSGIRNCFDMWNGIELTWNGKGGWNYCELNLSCKELNLNVT